MIPLLLYFHIHTFPCLDGILSDMIFMDFKLIYELVHTKGHNWVVSTLTSCHAYGTYDNRIIFQVSYPL